jgi:YrhK-like protein
MRGHTRETRLKSSGATDAAEAAASSRSSSLDLPRGWTSVAAAGPGPFVTRETFRRPDGAVVTWTSRQQRKRHSLLDTGQGSTWWAPGAVGWWIGVLFAVGSLCFALGAAPRFVDAVGVAADGVTFFVGSLFFTAAACLLYLEVANASRVPAGVEAPERRRLLTWEPHRIDWWAALVQLVGTVLFNVSTFDAMQEHLSASQANRLVWTPDAFGSICFLVASGLAWAEVSHGLWSWRPRSLSWLIAALNLAGSIAFGASAVASHVVPASDQPRNVTLMNLGTFVGALCFLIGAVLLLPERTRDDARSVPQSGGRR